MADPEVKPEESVKGAGDKPVPGAKKPGGFWQKYRMWIVGAAAVVLAIFWLMARNGSSGNANAASADQSSGSSTDPATGYPYGSPADIAALGGSGSVTAVPGATGPTGFGGAPGAPGKQGPRGPAGNGLTKLTFAQAQKIAGRNGSSSLFYGSGGKIVQGRKANDKNVQYYTTSQAAVKAGIL